MTNLRIVGLRGPSGADGGRIAHAAKRAKGLQARFALLVVVACAGVLALGAGSAQALLVHTYSFGTSGSAGGDLNAPQGVAVDQSTGDVYVVDAGNFRVEKFTPDSTTQSGGFDLAFGENVNTGGGNVCTTAATCQAGTADTTPGAFESPSFVAVDNSGGSSEGDVYVGDPGDNTISKFDSSGNLITSFGTGGQLSGTSTSTFGSMDGITIDNSGNLLLIDGNNTVWEFTSAGGSITNFPTTRGMSPTGLDVNDAGNIFKVNGDSSVEEVTSNGADVGEVGGSTTELTIDRSTGDLYQDTGTSINHYQFDSSGNVVDTGGPCPVVPDGSCAPTDTFGSGALTSGTGIGYDSTQTTLYAADAGNDDVVVFGPPSPGPPVIDGESASNLGSTTATINAEVNPFDNDTTCVFQYVDDTDFQATGFASATQVPCTPADLGTGFNDVQASANITGLTINTTYDFRVIATNSAAASGVDGSPSQFTTLGPSTIDSLSASNITADSAELDAQINPLGTDTTCVFKIVDDTDFVNNGGFSAPQTQTLNCDPADLGAGSTDVAASAQATNLAAGTTYDFEVIASNSLGDVSLSSSLQTLPPLTIDAESATHVTNTGATLNAEINPSGVDTDAQFQYVADSTFQSSGFTNATTVPATPIDLGSGIVDVAASVDLTGLTPGTKYDFRVEGSNSVGSLQGTTKTFMTLASIPAAGLPDSRAYELVSPVSKGGEVFDGLGGQSEVIGGMQAAGDGNSVGYLALSPFPGGTGPSINDLATRGPNGWSSKPILPEQAPGVTLELPGYLVYSSDLSKAILSNGGATVGGTGGQDDPALVPGSCTTPLFPTPPALPTTPCSGEVTGFPNIFVRNDTDGSFQLVNSYAEAPAGVTPVAANEDGASADLSTVVFDETAQLTADASTTSDNLYMSNGGTVKLIGAGATLGGSGRVLNAVSADGSRIFFTDSSGDLNVFQNGTATQVDKTQGGSGPGGGGQFMTAATDGSVVFFIDGDSAGLTGDTMSGSGANLYEYNVGSGTLSDLTGDQSLAQVDGVLGASSDGSYVYFVAEGVLASGATSGAENLYVDHDGTTTFIATLSGSDGSDWSSQLTSRVTPDGTHVAFDSVQSLTGFDNTDANTGGADTEIFLYDATAKTLVCASCNPTGNPIGSSQLDAVEGGLLGGGNQYLQHNLSDDGSRLFFDSSDDLSPRDTNGVQDVYEYENGHDYLISSGTSDSFSTFLDASANGNDVFFVTRDQLVPQDTDGENDLYDARVDGGFPAPSPVPPCTGDGCRSGTTPPPPAPTVATITFSGPSNPTPGAPVAKVAVSSKKVLKGFRFSVSVLVPGKGKITISGAGLKTVRKAVKHGGSYKLTVGLTSKERNALKTRGKRKTKITVHVSYRPAAGGSLKATFSVTVKA